MSKLFMIAVLAASAALYDPQRALSLIGADGAPLGAKLRAALSFERIVPKLAHLGGG